MVAMALISIVAATVMQAVGDSLARGLGMLGALAIIRFRTNLDNPVSITYMFATLAVGISCGVFGFTIAFAGTITFCIAALLLHYSPFWGTNNFRGSLKVSFGLHDEGDRELESLMKMYCKSYKIDQVRIESNEVEQKAMDPSLLEAGAPVPEPIKESVRSKEITYHIWMKDQSRSAEFMEKVYSLPGIQSARIRFSIPEPNL